jgi:hypothetical protein
MSPPVDAFTGYSIRCGNGISHPNFRILVVTDKAQTSRLGLCRAKMLL